METMINLIDLLKHEIMDLYSAEEQIIEALPAMIDKAKNADLKQALRQHLKITEDQKIRLDKVKTFLGESGEQEGGKEKRGFFSKLFGSGGEKCKGMEGLITEGNKMMSADISDEALDAAIIASAQKIEHYEISGYGTARAFARQLNLANVESLLTETLNEEYEADDRLTDLAVGKLNTKAEEAGGMEMSSGRRSRSRTSGGSNSKSEKGSGNNNSRSSKGSSKSSSKGSSKGSSKSSSKGSSGNISKGSSKGNSKGSLKSSSKSSSRNNSKGSSKGSSKTSSKNNSKGSSKSSSKSSSKKGSKKR